MAENKNEMKDSYTAYDSGQIGTVQIADEVVAIIAGLAATEVEGVKSMAGNITNELVGKLGMKNLPEVCKVVQEKVKSAIENMTGLSVSKINIGIAGVNLENIK